MTSYPSSSFLKLEKEDLLKKKIEKMLSWSSWRIVNFRGKKKRVRNAQPTENFWKIWHINKSTVKELGFSVSKYYDGWQVIQWEPL